MLMAHVRHGISAISRMSKTRSCRPQKSVTRLPLGSHGFQVRKLRVGPPPRELRPSFSCHSLYPPGPRSFKPVHQEVIPPHQLLSHSYCEKLSTWTPTKHASATQVPLNTVIKVVSWNIWGLYNIGIEDRINAAMRHLEQIFGQSPGHLVIMLQEVTKPVLDAIMRNLWVREYFQLSDVEGPSSQYEYVPGQSFILRQVKWEAGRYFTLMLVAKSLPVQNCFRVPLTTRMARDALVVDVLSARTELEGQGDLIRLCTTHLESMWDPHGYRPSQLSRLAAVLRGAPGMPGEGRVIGGMVGGDMNANDKSEHDFHKRPDIDLRDVWEDLPPPPPLRLKPFQKDETLGRNRGNTWGYQSKRKGACKRLDKFFYTGPLESVPLHEAQDVVGRLGRLGIGLRVETEA